MKKTYLGIAIGLMGISTVGCNDDKVYEIEEPNESIESDLHYYSEKELGNKAVKAHEIFFSEDGGVKSMAFQRDYLYYGLTDDAGDGNYDSSINEYLGFIEVEPNAYYDISDRWHGDESDDPKIINYSVSSVGKELTEEELVEKMWSQGKYHFKFELITSEKESPEVVMVELRPEQLWNLHIAKRIVKNKNGVKSYTYTINPDKFTKKRVDLSSLNLSLGSWNIKDESLDRYIRICEEDGGEQEDQTFELDWSLINPEWFDGDRKLYLGDRPIVVEKPIGGASSNIKKTEVTLSTFSDDDNLGTKTINFYDPVIIEKSNNGYLLQAYNTGIVTFGIIVR